ncbi:hypothetical protein HaLaN_31610 [Haematococcus lacustris]|uniref:Uncharacterized protein n=1 Tax=Haematococcus lacustris TaxID=44745 RepID=A0A6A0AHF7_HAELA|nr:hypothetical protein HaLaN_31610 [Haematococcus lacustris]
MMVMAYSASAISLSAAWAPSLFTGVEPCRWHYVMGSVSMCDVVGFRQATCVRHNCTAAPLRSANKAWSCPHALGQGRGWRVGLLSRSHPHATRPPAFCVFLQVGNRLEKRAILTTSAQKRTECCVRPYTLYTLQPPTHQMQLAVQQRKTAMSAGARAHTSLTAPACTAAPRKLAASIRHSRCRAGLDSPGSWWDADAEASLAARMSEIRRAAALHLLQHHYSPSLVTQVVEDALESRPILQQSTPTLIVSWHEEQWAKLRAAVDGTITPVGE